VEATSAYCLLIGGADVLYQQLRRLCYSFSCLVRLALLFLIIVFSSLQLPVLYICTVPELIFVARYGYLYRLQVLSSISG
jgi:hypothetical protein